MLETVCVDCSAWWPFWCLLVCLFVVRFPGQAYAATTNPGSPTIQYADSHWNCKDASCTSTVSSGEAQPNFECAEFVARSLAAEGLIPGLSPSSSQSAYGSYTALNGLAYDLNLIPPTSGYRTLYNYLIDTGLGTDVSSNLNQAAPAMWLCIMTGTTQLSIQRSWSRWTLRTPVIR